MKIASYRGSGFTCDVVLELLLLPLRDTLWYASESTGCPSPAAKVTMRASGMRKS